MLNKRTPEETDGFILSLFFFTLFVYVFNLLIDAEKDVNIWEESENNDTIQTEIENGSCIVVAATLNQLVRKATDEDKYGWLDVFVFFFFTL